MARKLTTILAADVAGYSRLMERDEQATLSALRRMREIIAKNVTAFHGRIFGGAGDSVIAEFGSAVEATETAIAIQKELASQGKDSGTTILQLRIGLNIGDVVIDGDDLLGMASMSPPGSRPSPNLVVSACRVEFSNRSAAKSTSVLSRLVNTR